MDYKALAAAQEEYVITVRRHLHKHPEISDHEDNTVAFISEELTKMGIPNVNVPHGGVFGFLGDEAKGRTVLLRADIDALPYNESPVNAGGKPKVVVSEVELAAHLCGHDCHAAMLLGAAKILKEHEDEINGRIILMFERGEEGTGNLTYLVKYLFDNHYKIDTSFGMHVFPDVPVGQVAVIPGPCMAGPLGFSVTLKGKSAHGSEPSVGRSPVDAFVSLYGTMANMRMKYANPYDPMVFSVGQVHSGSASNIIPGELTFGGSFRVHNFEDGTYIREKLIQAIENTAEMYDCKAEYTIIGPNLALVNDPECTAFARNVFAETLGNDAVFEAKPLMGSESHAMTAKIWPGVFLFLGIYNEEKGMTARNHHECFEPDEDCLKIGTACHVAYALEYLNDGPSTEGKVYNGDLKEFYEKYNPRALVAYENE